MIFGVFHNCTRQLFLYYKSLFPLQKMNLVCFILKGKNFVLSIENQYLTYSLFCPLFYSFFFSLFFILFLLSLLLFYLSYSTFLSFSSLHSPPLISHSLFIFLSCLYSYLYNEYKKYSTWILLCTFLQSFHLFCLAFITNYEKQTLRQGNAQLPVLFQIDLTRTN